MDYLEELNLKLSSLVIFRNLLQDKALGRLPAMLSHNGKSTAERVADYSGFASGLLQANVNLTDYLWQSISSDQNLYILKCARREEIDPILEQCLLSELRILEEVSQLTGRQIRRSIGYQGYLPEWKNSPADYVKAYQNLMGQISTAGYGPFLKYRMFFIKDSRLIPVGSPDPIRLSDLKGYERERQTVIDNTKALLNGKPAANTLLYGDAGTGKSSTVKAIVNEYANLGLRLIEIRKNQFLEIPAVIESLHRNPLKFILFVDDLSFAQSNEEIGVLKAILEGTVSAKAPNVVIYATSNRRHLVNEKFSERGDDEIHRNETIQEQVSLSERFGLSVNFSKPDKDQYLSIVGELARQYDVGNIPNLELLAERYALGRGGRSPRVARQFVEYLLSMEE
jgi:predicted AAA+ superfamily ATPase